MSPDLQAQYRDAGNLSARIRLHREFSTNPEDWHRWVYRWMELPEAGPLLEVGCGNGALWRRNAERLPAGCRPILTDRSPGMVAAARESLRNLAPAFRLAVTGAEVLPFRDGAFRVVLAHHVLFHVTDRSAALAEIARVLEPGGILYAATNGRAHLREIDRLMQNHGGEPVLAGPAEAFGLETGREQLEARFDPVTLVRHQDALEITRAEPLVEYVRSLPSERPLPTAALAELRREVEAEIRARGSLRVTKDSGLFRAVCPA